MASNETATTKSGLRPARRTIVKGAAWAVPAVAVASAAPAYAASPTCVTAEYLGGACKCPGSGNDWSYYLGFCFTNTCATGDPIKITVTNLTNNAGKPFTPSLPNPPELELDPLEEACTTLSFHTSESSAAKVRIFYSLNDEPMGYFELDAPPDCAAGTCPSDSTVAPSVEEPAVEEPAPGADTESTTASPQG